MLRSGRFEGTIKGGKVQRGQLMRFSLGKGNTDGGENIGSWSY